MTTGAGTADAARVDVGQAERDSPAVTGGGIVAAVPHAGLVATRTWIFDLDNTLYPSECKLFLQIDHKMGEFISRLLGVSYEQAQHLRRTYYRQFGTTLTGLMRVHRIEPAPFLEYVHDLDLSAIEPHPELREAIARLDGRRLIFTNGSHRHAERVATKLGILDLFEDICGIEACEYTPKPDAAAFDRMIRRHDVDPAVSAMFEDMPQNLEVPHVLGMRTVLVHTAHPDHPHQIEVLSRDRLPDHIHFKTDDLPGFLSGIPPR